MDSEAATGPTLLPIPAVLLSGALLTLAFPLQFWSFAVPGSWQGYTAWLAWTPVLLAARAASPRKTALLVGCASGIMFAGTTFWIVVAMVEYGGVPLPLALLALILLAALLACFHAGAGFLAGWARVRGGLPLSLTFPLALTAMELARNSWLTGFPWSNLAYSQARFLSIAQVAEFTGIYGLTFLLALTGGGLAELLSLPKGLIGRLRTPLLGAGGLVLLLLSDLAAQRFRMPLESPILLVVSILGALLLGAVGIWMLSTAQFRTAQFRTAQTRAAATFPLALAVVLLLSGWGRVAAVSQNEGEVKTLKTALLQGNIAQDQKWLETAADHIKDIYRGQVKDAIEQGADLVVWPEASVPDVLPADLEVLPAELFPSEGPGALQIVGAPVYRPGEPGELTMHNSAFLVDSRRTVLGRYDKTHLVPFGEYVPLSELLSFLGPLVEAVGTFKPGTALMPLSDGHHRLGVVICYEDIFPEIGREQVKNGAQLLLNITNDAWYGPTSALQQHLDMAVFRAIETRRAVARAANTGISAFVGPGGQLVGRTRPWEPAVLVAPIPLLESLTFYVRFGDVFAWACSVLLVGCLVGVPRQARQALHRP